MTTIRDLVESDETGHTTDYTIRTKTGVEVEGPVRLWAIVPVGFIQELRDLRWGSSGAFVKTARAIVDPTGDDPGLTIDRRWPDIAVTTTSLTVARKLEAMGGSLRPVHVRTVPAGIRVRRYMDELTVSKEDES